MGIVVHIVDATIVSDTQRFGQKSSRSQDDVVIEVGAMCNGVVQALSSVKKATKKGSIDLVMIVYGHGAAGIQGVSMGKGERGVDGSRELSAININVLDNASVISAFTALAENFSSRGSIVMHGCNVAEGTKGKEFISKLAKVSGVPVKGSDWFQLVGRSDLAGNIFTANPGGDIVEDSLAGMKNLGGYPAGEGLLLLGVEFGDRILRRLGLR